MICADCYHTPKKSCCTLPKENLQVPVAEEDARRISEGTGIPWEDTVVLREYTDAEIAQLRNNDLAYRSLRADGKGYLLPLRESGECVYLDPEAGCTLGPYKPLYCQAYPFFLGTIDGVTKVYNTLDPGCLATEGLEPTQPDLVAMRLELPEERVRTTMQRVAVRLGICISSE